jgi:hypothetical protein
VAYLKLMSRNRSLDAEETHRKSQGFQTRTYQMKVCTVATATCSAGQLHTVNIPHTFPRLKKWKDNRKTVTFCLSILNFQDPKTT